MQPPILLWLSVLLCLSVVKSQNCEARGGTCVSKPIGHWNCISLPLKCGSGLRCCQKTADVAFNRAHYRRQKRPNKNSPNPNKPKASQKQTRPQKPKTTKGKKGNTKQLCSTTSAKCSKQSGVCVPAVRNSCISQTVDSLCGKGCTCCTGGSDNCKCGQANEVRIVGGQEVTPMHKYPWMVSFVTNSIFFCGGAIINDLYVLTAAHCVYGETPKTIKVAVGNHNQLSHKDDIPSVTQNVAVAEIIIHEKYSDYALDNDIALVKLKEPLHLSAFKEIRSVCLPTTKTNSFEGYNATVMGWGLQEFSDDNSAANNLMEVTVPILSPDCPGNLPKKVDITENMICAGYKVGGKDACVGDSGGPLVVREGSAFVIVGIVSFGFNCAKPNVPGVYTRVSQYIDWIAKNTQGAVYCT